MKKHAITALSYTAITAILLGVLYPLSVTLIARVFLAGKANGQLQYAPKSASSPGLLLGSKLIGQPFTGPPYFHSRPSAAGTGYDASSSSGSNLGPTSKTLVDRIAQQVKDENAPVPVPVDLVTASASGLDPDITPAAALFQVKRVAAARGMKRDAVQALVETHIQRRQFGFLGEPRVNVLALNLDLNNAAR